MVCEGIDEHILVNRKYMASKRTMIKLLRCSVLLILCHIAQGLDVELEGITCNESLPVTADLYMKCSEGARCTFGGNSTTLYGTRKFCNWQMAQEISTETPLEEYSQTMPHSLLRPQSIIRELRIRESKTMWPICQRN